MNSTKMASNHSQPHSHNVKSFDQVVAEEESFIGRKLSPHELDSVKERVNYLKLHEGHEQAHSTMLWIIILGLAVSFILINTWKKWHRKSFDNLTLLGLWIVPLIVSLQKSFYFFLCLHLVFTISIGFIIRLTSQSTLQPSTPRRVYAFFSSVYQVALITGALGYFVTLCAFFHLPMLVFGFDVDGEADIFIYGMTIMFCGLYFGTLGRDFAERVSGEMGFRIGYYAAGQAFPRRHLREGVCGVCGDEVRAEKFSLNCGHVFHELCIRGWTIVGKKETCPYCKEKVDLRMFRTHVWDEGMRAFLGLIDWMRFLVVWNPAIFYVIHLIIEALGLK